MFKNWKDWTISSEALLIRERSEASREAYTQAGGNRRYRNIEGDGNDMVRSVQRCTAVLLTGGG